MSAGRRGATSRHYVTIIAGKVPRGKSSGRPVLFAYSYSAVAELAGVEDASVRKACQARRGRPPTLVMADLLSVAAYIQRHQRRAARKAATP